MAATNVWIWSVSFSTEPRKEMRLLFDKPPSRAKLVEVLQRAVQSGSFASSLRPYLDGILADVMFEMPEKDGDKEVVYGGQGQRHFHVTLRRVPVFQADSAVSPTVHDLLVHHG